MKERNDKPVIKEQPATYDDYAQLPDDGERYELTDGVLELMSPAPSPKHQAISSYLLAALMTHCQSGYIILAAPIDLILSNTDVRQPDLVMVHRSKIDIITRRGIEGVPDLVAEIISPHSAKRDRYSKLKTYAQYQIPEYWIIDPLNESLEQYILSIKSKYDLHHVYDKEETIQSGHLPCVSFNLGKIMDAAAELPG